MYILIFTCSIYIYIYTYMCIYIYCVLYTEGAGRRIPRRGRVGRLARLKYIIVRTSIAV